MGNAWHTRPLHPDDLELAGRLKLSDASEIALLDIPARQALAVSAAHSTICEAIELGGDLVGAWGFALEGATRARIWLVTAPEAIQHRRRFLTFARELVYIGLAHAPELYNWIAAENRESRRLVRALGFVEDGAQQFGPYGAQFIMIRRFRHVH